MRSVTSLIGTWTQQVALSRLVHSLTSSTLLLGVVAFANQAPILFFSPFAGVAADRWNRRRLLLRTRGLSMVQALVLAALVPTGEIETRHIVTLSVFIGTINAFDICPYGSHS
jgi:MFS family permease